MEISKYNIRYYYIYTYRVIYLYFIWRKIGHSHPPAYQSISNDIDYHLIINIMDWVTQYIY